MGVKQVALMVAAIVLIGAVVLFLTGGFLENTITEVWEWMWTQIQGFFS